MDKIKKVLIFLTLIFGVLFFARISLAAVYYVAANGNNSNPGTEDKPWQTIQNGVNTMVAGDTLYVRGGTYNEKITISSGGSNGNYKTIQNYPNETPVVDGGNTKDRGFDISNNVNYVKIIGFEIKNFTDFAITNWYNRSNSYLTIQNNNIHDNGGAGPIYQSDSSHSSGGGIALHSGSNKLSNIIINNNTIDHNFVQAILLFTENYTDGCHDITVSNNLIYRNPKNMLAYGDTHSLSTWGCFNMSIYNNYIYFNQKAPRIDEYGNNNNIYNNVFAYNGFNGLEIHYSSSNNTIKNNILAYNNIGGINVKSSGTTGNKIWNNIFYDNGYLNLYENEQATFTGFQNNIFSGGGALSMVCRINETPDLLWNTHDYNDYYDIANYVSGNGCEDGVVAIGNWIGQGKIEVNSQNINPSFTNSDYLDFTTAVSSLQNTGNNPSGDCDKIGLCSNFIDNTKIFPYIGLTVASANYDTAGVSKTIDHKTSIYSSSYAWQSNSPSGEIIYEVTGGSKLIKYIGLSGDQNNIYYSPKDFHIAVSVTGTNPGDFTDVLDATFVVMGADAWSVMTQWFEFSNAVSAKYIKLTIDNSQKDYSAATNPNVQVSEFYAIGPLNGNSSDTTPPTVSITSPVSTLTGPFNSCVGTVSTSTAINGTGWVLVNFSDNTGGSALSSLPLDPINNSSFYYGYAGKADNNTFELDAVLESIKYRTLMSADGGDNPLFYEIGTALNL